MFHPYAPHATCHGMHKLSLFPTTMDVTLNMLLKTAPGNHCAWCTFPLKRDSRMILKSLWICYISHVEEYHNLQSSALSQSKIYHSGTLNVYICKHGNHSGGPLRLAENTPERLLKNSMCYTEWKSKGQRTLINKTIYCHIVLKIWMTFIHPLSGPNQCWKQIKKKNQ